MHLAQTEQRLSMIAFDIHKHFLNYCKPRGFKAMAAVSTRALAVQLEHAINGLGGVKAAALICDDSVSSEGDEGTVTKNDKAIIRDFFKNEVEPRFGTKYDDYEEYVKNNIIGGEDVDIVIVQSMLLTGFDAPSLGVLYVDKPMKEHSLLQAIARVNRIAAGKDFGLIVDYWGLFGNLNNAMEMYSDDQSGLSGYDPADIAESIVTAAEGQEKLKEAHKALWNFFGDVTFDQNNPRAWVAFFEKEDAAESEKLRKEFYEKLAAFSKMMTMAVGNYSLYQSIGFDQMQNYKADLLFFQKLRSALMMVYAEKVDFSKYEDGIRSLLNTFVTSEPVEIVVEPVAIHDKAAMDKQLEEVEGQKAKAAYIHTRIVSELESRRYEDPMLFKRFSERIRETIAEYRRSRDENIYLASMKRMAEDLRQGFTGHSYPTAISNDSDAKAFYGVVSDILKQHGQDSLEFDDAIGKLALDMKQAVQSLARVDWRTSTPIHKKMNQAVEDLLWDFCDEFGVDLPIDKMDILIENAIKTAMSRY